MSNASLESRIGFHSPNEFKLGLFAMNCSSGTGPVTSVPERWSGSWEDNLAVAKMADDSGIEFLLPLARWKGYGGKTDYQGEILEPLTWAVAILANTKNISVFATMHVPLFHPLVAAKQMVLADLVSRGRFGLNVVCGWNADEFDMFGVELIEHDLRYKQAEEWLSIILQAWSEKESFDFKGDFYDLKAVRAKPKPYGDARPIFMNAGDSPAGQAFAGRNCDAYFGRVRQEFMMVDLPKILHVKNIARERGQNIEVFTAGSIICRATQREAQDYYHYCAVENVEWDAVDQMLKLRGVDLDAREPEVRQHMRAQMARGFSGMPIVGTPELIAKHFADLYAAGVRGFALQLINYKNDFPLIRDEVFPRLERLGLRRKR